MIFADLNGDGRAEYVWVGSSGEATAFINGGLDAQGKLLWHTPTKIADGIPGASRGDIRFADLNGDGRAEYIRVYDTGKLDIWLNQRRDTETGTKLDINGYLQENSAPGFGHDGADQFADLNGDGRAEYLWVDEAGAVTVFLNAGGKDAGPNAAVITWLLQEQSAGGVGWARSNAVFADTNGEGRADYLRVSRTDGNVEEWLNGGGRDAGPNAGVITWLKVEKPIAVGGVDGKGVMFADINGDGRAEYLIVDGDTSAVQMFWNGCKE